MRWNFNLIWILLIVIGLLSCKSNISYQNTKGYQNQHNILDSVILNYFSKNDSVKIIPNNKGNWLLCITEDTVSKIEPVIDIRFLVYDEINKEILYKNSYTRASLLWFNNKQLLLTRRLGIIDKDTQKGIKQYLIDIETKQVKEYNPDNKSTK